MPSDSKFDHPDNHYIPYNPQDENYYGANKIIEAEIRHIQTRQITSDPTKNKNNLTGLALSGGGFRSASFCLGVIQMLSHKNCLGKFDYLSTVAGGGYIGSTVTWLLSKKWQSSNGQSIDFGVDRNNFPLGTYPMMDADNDSVGKNNGAAPKYRGALLRYLKQNNRYLENLTKCGPDFSLIYAILRNSFVSVFLYFALLTLLFTAVWYLQFFDSILEIHNKSNYTFNYLQYIPTEILENINFATFIAIVGLSLFVSMSIVFYVFGFFVVDKRPLAKGSKEQPDVYSKILTTNEYLFRRTFDNFSIYLINILFLFFIIGTLPIFYELFNQLNIVVVTCNTLTSITGLDGKWCIELNKGNLYAKYNAPIAGFILLLIALFTAIIAYFRSSHPKPTKYTAQLFSLISVFSLFSGLLLTAFFLSKTLIDNIPAVIILTVFTLMFSYLFNLNLGLHIFYRDRLMEAFLPDAVEVLDPTRTPGRANRSADKALLSNMCGYNNPESSFTPYHIINCNIALHNSKIAKFRGRGGDSFILSPGFCGSNATGWVDTQYFMSNRMTLATAMAISGAAVTSNTSFGKSGAREKSLTSTLMGMLNCRLGHWVVNPNPAYRYMMNKPNFLIPGVSNLFSCSSQSEHSQHLLLTDGTHFDELGLYELVRRKLDLIVVCDATYDPNYEFKAFCNSLEKIRSDFGALIDIPSEKLKQLSPKYNPETKEHTPAERGFFIANILYKDREPGKLVYLKTTLTGDLSSNTWLFGKGNPNFPSSPLNESRFNENEFEAYRELGNQLALQMISHRQVKEDNVLKNIFLSY